MEHCMIDGKRCSKCCEVLTIRESKNFREWRRYVRRYGYSRDFSGDKIFHMLRKISKRRAKKINTHLVNIINNKQAYFTCKNYTGKGCSIYNERPKMCSGYPHYGRTTEEMMSSDTPDLYREGCTYFVSLD